MVCWTIKNGVPFDVAHEMPDWMLLAYSIVFAQLKNGHREWDWDNMRFLERAT
jgi:hypothetical protein